MNRFIQLTDPTFQTQLAGKCDLLLEILPGGMNFAVVDKGQDELKVLVGTKDMEPVAEKIKELIPTELALSYHYRKVKAGLFSLNFTLIPEDLFDQDMLADYAKFFSFEEGDLILTDSIRAAKCVIVFTIPAAIVNVLKETFHQPQFYHTATSLIEAGTKLSKQTEHKMALLNFRNDCFEAVLLHEGRLLFYNSFPSRTADEFNYFLLNLIDHLQLSAEQTDWILAGELNTGFTERLKKYTDRVSEANKQQFLKVADTFNAAAGTDFYSLTALSLCE
ncbi:MAG: DUF3822 family protein [Sphingobacteriaceae bacterium]